MAHRILTLATVASSFIISLGYAQSPPEPSPRFEVATIKLSNGPGAAGMRTAGRRLNTSNTALIDLLAFAYALHPRQITGGPTWVGTEKYDVTAEASATGTPNAQQMKVMIQKLIADRFSLTFHRDTKELSVYEIVAGKTGPKFTGSPGDPNLSPGFGFRGLGAMTVRSATVADFAGWMQRYVMDRPVVDHTGIPGRYNFSLNWTPDDSQFSDRAGYPPAQVSNTEPPDLYTAIQEQLGLKLESAKAPVEVLVIDHVERPPEN